MHTGPRAQRSGHVASQELRQRGLLDLPARVLAKHAHAGQRPQDSLQRVGVRVYLFCNFSGSLSAALYAGYSQGLR